MKSIRRRLSYDTEHEGEKEGEKEVRVVPRASAGLMMSRSTDLEQSANNSADCMFNQDEGFHPCRRSQVEGAGFQGQDQIRMLDQAISLPNEIITHH